MTLLDEADPLCISKQIAFASWIEIGLLADEEDPSGSFPV